jgi:hypothetical protein
VGWIHACAITWQTYHCGFILWKVTHYEDTHFHFWKPPITSRRPVCRPDNLTTLMCRLSWNLRSSTSWNPLGLSRPIMGFLSLFPPFPITSSLSGPHQLLGSLFLTPSAVSPVQAKFHTYLRQVKLQLCIMFRFEIDSVL